MYRNSKCRVSEIGFFRWFLLMFLTSYESYSISGMITFKIWIWVIVTFGHSKFFIHVLFQTVFKTTLCETKLFWLCLFLDHTKKNLKKKSIAIHFCGRVQIFQLVHRVATLEECTSHDPTSAMSDSRFDQKFQPPVAHRLPHGGFTHRAETAWYGRSGT